MKVRNHTILAKESERYTMKKYYAVKKGRKTGVFYTWDECRAEVTGYPGAVYKSFPSFDEALAFVRGAGTPASANPAGNGNGKAAVQANHEEHIPYAYVDGSFNASTGVYGYGVILVTDTKRYEFSGSGSDGEMASMRNVAGEIEGAMRAVKEAEELGLKSLAIYYDYMGIECWANGSWKTNKEGTRNYRQYMQAQQERIQIRFHKVAAHTGVELNEAVDQLAKKAAGI